MKISLSKVFLGPPVCCAILTVVAMTGPWPATAQAPAADGSTVRVSLLTFGPGEIAWERFGHNGLRIQDPVNGLDLVFDYGRFSFQQENFRVRFVQGRMLYWTEGTEASWVLNAYRNAGRWIREQELSLTVGERVELRDFLIENAREENKYYRYHYYLDNCSTRLRDAIDLVTNGAIRQRLVGRATGTTFRFHTRRLTSSDVPLYTGLQLGLGHPVDRPIDAWEEMFLPFKLSEYLRDVTTLDEAGNVVPLVRVERMLFESDRFPVASDPPRWIGYFLLVGLGIGGLLVGLARAGGARRWARLTYGAVATILMLVVGLAGLALTGLWVATDHTTSYWNQNILVFSPVATVLAILIPFALAGSPRALRAAYWSILFVLGSMCLAVVLWVMPWTHQVNGELIGVVVPVMAGLAVGAQAVVRSSGEAG